MVTSGCILVLVPVFVWIFQVNKVSCKALCFTDGQGRQQRCGQICDQAGENYTCSCLRGYRLTYDGHSCDITGKEEPAMFYISGSNKIVTYLPEDQSLLQTVLTNNGRVTDFAFGPARTLYWADNKRGTVSKIQFDETFTAGTEYVIVDSGLESPSGLSLDWFTGILYIVDTQTGTLVVCTIKGYNCTVLLRYLVNPQEVVVEPVNRRIFWSDWGRSEKEGAIYSASTDGKDRYPLAEGLERPTDLTVDRETRAVFWLASTATGVDPVVQMVFWDKGHKEGVHTFHGSTMRPAFLLILSQLYVHEHVDVARQVNITGNMETRATSEFLPRHGKIKMYNGEHFLQEIKDNKCASAKCSHVCLHSNSLHGYTCLCPLDMELVSPTTCKKSNVDRLLTSGDRVPGIHEVPIQYIGLSSLRPRRLVPGTVSCFAYGPAGQVIVYHNEETQTLEKTSLVSLGETSVLLYYNESGIEGITIHEATGYIYWTNRQGHVTRGTLDGGLALTIIDGLNRPRGIAVDSDNSHLYVCECGSGLILRCQTDSRNPYGEHMIRAPRGHPNDVIIHHLSVDGEMVKALIWTDSKLDHIGLMPLGDNREQREISLNETSMPHPYALAAVGKLVFYTDLNSGAIHVIDQTGLSRVLAIALDLGSLHSVVVFRYVTERTRPEHVSETRISTNVTQDRGPGTIRDTDDVIVIVGVASALIVIATVAIAVIFLYRQRMQKRSWLSGIINYVKDQPPEDSQQLMTHIAASNPGFLNLEDLDYPEVHSRRHHDNASRACSREFSTISTDSAFTEMHDSTTNSIDSA